MFSLNKDMIKTLVDLGLDESLLNIIILSKKDENNATPPEDEKYVFREIAFLIELHIIENIHKFQDANIKALASIYFDIISSSFSLFEEIVNDCAFPFKNFNILKYITIAYIGERYNDLQKMLLKSNFDLNECKDNLYERILNMLTKNIIYLTLGNQEMLNSIITDIKNLRENQEEIEKTYFESIKDDRNRYYITAEIVALYYFTRIIELLAKYSLGQPLNVDKNNYLLERAQHWALAAKNSVLELILNIFDVFMKKHIERVRTSYLL